MNNIKVRFNKDKLTPISTPIELGTKFDKNKEQANSEDIKLY